MVVVGWCVLDLFEDFFGVGLGVCGFLVLGVLAGEACGAVVEGFGHDFVEAFGADEAEGVCADVFAHVVDVGVGGGE